MYSSLFDLARLNGCSGILCTAMVYDLSYATKCAAYSYWYNTIYIYMYYNNCTLRCTVVIVPPHCRE